MKTAAFFSDNNNSLMLGWKEGLIDCGISKFYNIPKHFKEQSQADLYFIENPTENDLDFFNTKTHKEKYVCIVGDGHKDYYKNYPHIDLWVEPCFYDKITEKAFEDDNLPFYYCPNAARRIPFYTELQRKFDLSVDSPFRKQWEVVVIPSDTPEPEAFYGNTKVNLNYQIPRKDYIYLNQKCFDIPMSGNFELSTISEVTEIFEKNVGYTSETEMMDKIQYYIDHEEERTRMSIKAYEVCIRDHNYSIRMNNLLKKLDTL